MPLFGKREQQQIDHQRDVIIRWGPVSDAQWRRVTRLIGDRWLSVAASAWEGYELAGSGCLGVSFERNTTQYLPETALSLPDAPQGDLWREVRRMCEAYDPYTEMGLVIFHVGAANREDACLLLRTPPGWATPPEAYQQLGVVRAN